MTREDAIRQWAQGEVWGRADHECGGLHAGACLICDEDAKYLAQRVEKLVTSLGYHGTQPLSEAIGSAQSEAPSSNTQPASLSQSVADAKARWLPIESAPRDGTHILGFWGFREDRTPEIDRTLFELGEWRDPDGDEGCAWAEPTHWMPLPPPPRAGTVEPQEPQ